MKCERCHQADATTAVTVKKDGAEKELYVCCSLAVERKLFLIVVTVTYFLILQSKR